MNIRAKQIYSVLLGLTILISGCTQNAIPQPGFYYPAICLCLGMSAATQSATVNPNPVVVPTPEPSPVPSDTTECPRCKGTGKVKFGRREVECRMCGGTGKVKTKPKAQEEHSVVERSWLAPDDFVHDMSSYYQARQLAKDGNQCVLIDFAPDWCEPCQKDSAYLDQPSIIEGLDKDFVLFRVKDGDLYKAFGLDKKHKPDYPVPRMIVVAPNGSYRSFNPDPQYFNSRLNSALNSLGVK